MLTLSLMVSVSLLISGLILSLTVLVSEKSMKEREKMTPFECGFSPFKKARMPFSLRFFMITLIFIIFDMEVAMVLPLGVIFSANSASVLTLTAGFVVVILTGGLLHEWKNGALSWI